MSSPPAPVIPDESHWAFRWFHPPTFTPLPGPLPVANWVISSRLACGAHPTTECNELGQVELAMDALAYNKIDCIASLQEPSELTNFLPYEEAFLKRVPNATFLKFPITDKGVPSSIRDCMDFVSTLLHRMRRGHNIYLHCWGGHGRTGTIGTILLACIYQLSPEDALKRWRLGHHSRLQGGMKESPEGAAQTRFIFDMIKAIHAWEEVQEKELQAKVNSPFAWRTTAQICQSKTEAKGPTVLSNYVFPNLLCAGGYPSAAEFNKALGYAEAMTAARFDIYVNLMTTDELKRFRPYADFIAFKSEKLEPALPWKSKPDFLHFPIEDGDIPENQDAFIALIYELNHQLRVGKRIYVHCWGGHGRTGTVLSSLLGVLRPELSMEEVFGMVQKLHSYREYNPSHLSPEPTQRPFVEGVVEAMRKLPPNYKPAPEHKVSLLEYTPHVESCGNALTNSGVAARAGGGEGVIIVDSQGTASTTAANTIVPSTPLVSPARLAARQGAEPPEIGHGLLQREMLRIHDPFNPHSLDQQPHIPAPFTLFQMNMLADSLCDSKSFPHTCAQALDWNLRKHQLLDELLGINRKGDQNQAVEKPDIITIQECDHFHDWFEPELVARGGYTSSVFFKKKSDDSKDGVAVFINPQKFRVLQKQTVMIEGFNQVAIFLQLMPLSGDGTFNVKNSHRLYVVTTHLKAKDGFEKVRLKQVQIILQHLQDFISKYHSTIVASDSMGTNAHAAAASAASIASCLSSSGKLGGNVSPANHSPSTNPAHSSLGFSLPDDAGIVFAGDFNDIPNSPMYNHIISGSSTEDLSDLAPRDGTASGVAASSTKAIPQTVRHPFWLQSLYNRFYEPAHPANESMLYTTIKHRQILVQRTIDYIFFTPHTLLPSSILSIPKVNTQLPDYLPAVNYPSDHLSIAGRFDWKR